MAKEFDSKIKLQVRGGGANPSPPRRFDQKATAKSPIERIILIA